MSGAGVGIDTCRDSKDVSEPDNCAGVENVSGAGYGIDSSADVENVLGTYNRISNCAGIKDERRVGLGDGISNCA